LPLDSVSVTVVAAPSHFVLDGEVSEWGSLLPPPPSLDAKNSARRTDPSRALSHVAVAFHGGGAFIAGDLSGALSDGVWLGIASEPSDPPKIGQPEASDCTPSQFHCDVEPYTKKPRPPEEAKTCQALEDRYAAFVAANAARFRRLYRIDAGGVRTNLPDGSLTAVEGASAVFRAGVGRATMEAVLPAKTLPRMAQAPLEVVSLLVASAAAPTPLTENWTHWGSTRLPAGVGFDPWAALRAAGYRANGSGGYSLGRSYQPGDRRNVEAIVWEPTPYSREGAVRYAQGYLYEKKASLGDIEVGYGMWNTPFLVVLRGGQLRAVESTLWEQKGIVKRDGELHVLVYDSGFTPENPQGPCSQESLWRVIGVDASGELHERIDQDSDKLMKEIEWYTVTPFSSPAFDHFGMRGTYDNGAGPSAPDKGLEIFCSWNAGTHTYACRKRKITPPPRKSQKQ
jgi:hypothetical protein